MAFPDMALPIPRTVPTCPKALHHLQSFLNIDLIQLQLSALLRQHCRRNAWYFPCEFCGHFTSFRISLSPLNVFETRVVPYVQFADQVMRLTDYTSDINSTLLRCICGAYGFVVHVMESNHGKITMEHHFESDVS